MKAPSVRDTIARAKLEAVSSGPAVAVESAKAIPVEGANATTLSRDDAMSVDASTETVLATVPPMVRQGIRLRRQKPVLNADGKKTVTRHEAPHTSLYLHANVARAVKQIAILEDCRPHEVLIEGVRMVLERYGYELERLERGEVV